jgi:hypothetical protein
MTSVTYLLATAVCFCGIYPVALGRGELKACEGCGHAPMVKEGSAVVTEIDTTPLRGRLVLNDRRGVRTGERGVRRSD